MMIDEWLDFFRENINKKLFSLSDIVLLTGERRSSVSVQLSRLVSSGILDRPVRGWYANPFNTPTDEELAMVIRNPSYLSMEYALSRHGVLSQNVFTYTLVTTKLPYTFHSGDRVFEYHQMKRSLFWGYHSEGMVLIAEPEKALLDFLYVRLARGREMARSTIDSLVDDLYIENLDRDRLSLYSNKFDGVTRSYISDILGTQ